MLASEEATALFLVGSIFFPGSFLCLQHFWRKNKVGQQIKKHYRLTDRECADISVKLVSALQAILASIVGTLVCSKCYENVLYCTHPILLKYAYFGGPYFIYDAIAMFYVSKISDKHYRTMSKSKYKKNSKGIFSTIKQFLEFVAKSPVILVHHTIMAPIGFSIIIYFRGIRGDFFIGVMYLMEASTPFVSFRFILSKLQMKHTLWYKMNAAVMLVSFPVFRIASVFYTVGLYAEQQEMAVLDVFRNMHPGWLFVFVASIAPQIYWFFLMWCGLINILRKSKELKLID